MVGDNRTELEKGMASLEQYRDHPAFKGTEKAEGGDPLAKYEHDIRRFMDAMKYKLAKNAHKGRWEDLDLPTAMNLLYGEYVELQDAITSGNMVEIMLEAADVANFALMVAAIAMERGR